MLKLTHSFYRFLPLSCEPISYNIFHVKTFSHLNTHAKTCTSIINQSISFNPFIHNNLQWRQLGNKGKRFEIKKLFNKSNAEIKDNQMGDPLRPTATHSCCGGEFTVDPIDEAVPCVEYEEAGPMDPNDGRNDRNINVEDIRMWENVENWSQPSDSNSFRFKIMSYNVLAQCLLDNHSYLYKNCSPDDLHWDVRSARIYDEIVNLDPDILCLQEVQASHTPNFYSRLEDIGYYGIFKQKTGSRQDGCAIYFKLSKFYLEDFIGCASLSDAGMNRLRLIVHLNLGVRRFMPKLIEDLGSAKVEFCQPELPSLNRDNVGLAVRLRPRPDISPEAAIASPVVIATTHLLYNPKRTDVRLAQMQLFLAEIDRFAYCSNATYSGYYPIILTGDFNSTPESSVSRLLNRGYVRPVHYHEVNDWRLIGITDNCQHLAVYLYRLRGLPAQDGMLKIFNSQRYWANFNQALEIKEAQERVIDDAILRNQHLFNGNEVTNPFRLSSVYRHRKADGAYEATTFQDAWITVDYIYYSRCNPLRLLQRLRLPTDEECLLFGPLPNHMFPSDHLSLAAIFELRPLVARL